MSKRVNRASSVVAPKAQGQKVKQPHPKHPPGTQMYPRLGGTSQPAVKGTDFERFGKHTRLRGRELLQTLSTPLSAPAQGDSAFTVLLGSSLQTPLGVASLYNIQQANNSPVTTYGPNTRIGGLMRYWSRFRCRRLRLIYEPRCTVTVPGALSFRYFTDPTDSYQSPARAWQAISASSESRQGNVYERIVVDARLDEVQDLYVDISERESASVSNSELRQLFQGVFIGIYSAGIPAATALGDVYLEYDIQMMSEELPDTVYGGPTPSTTDDSVVLYGLADSTSTTSIPLDPAVGPVKDRTASMPVGETYPSWWDPVTKTITAVGDYLMQFSSDCYSGGASNGQINSTSTYSATLSGPSVANPDYPPVNGNSATAYPLLTGLYKFTVTALPFVLPYFFNFSSASTARAAGAIQAIIMQSELAGADHLRVTTPVEDSETALVRLWLRTFNSKLAEDVAAKACSDLFSCLGCAPDGVWHGVQWPDIKPILQSDLSSNVATAQTYFSDDPRECIPRARRQLVPRNLPTRLTQQQGECSTPTVAPFQGSDFAQRLAAADASANRSPLGSPRVIGHPTVIRQVVADQAPPAQSPQVDDRPEWVVVSHQRP